MIALESVIVRPHAGCYRRARIPSSYYYYYYYYVDYPQYVPGTSVIVFPLFRPILAAFSKFILREHVTAFVCVTQIVQRLFFVQLDIGVYFSRWLLWTYIELLAPLLSYCTLHELRTRELV